MCKCASALAKMRFYCYSHEHIYGGWWYWYCSMFVFEPISFSCAVLARQEAPRGNSERAKKKEKERAST